MQEHDLRRIDLNLLIVLRTLLETSSVSRTAQRLGMSQPAVSRALASLRLVFSDPLLVKSGSAMLPTPRALELREALENVAMAVSAALDPPRQFDPRSTRRCFRIATTDYGAAVVLPGLSRVFFVEAPEAGVEVLNFSRQSFADLAHGDLDLVFYADNPVPQSLRTRELFRERFACLVRAGHPVLAQGGALSLETYLAHAHILVTITGGRTGPVDAALAAMGRQRRISLWLPYFATAALAAASSDLILTIPRRAATAFAGNTGLRMLAPPVQLVEYGYRMIWHERVHQDPAHVWLRRLIVDVTRDPDFESGGP